MWGDFHPLACVIAAKSGPALRINRIEEGH
jgi:hypothetical protein